MKRTRHIFLFLIVWNLISFGIRNSSDSTTQAMIYLILFGSIAVALCLALYRKLKSSRWPYRLYRFRSPATADHIVRPPYSPGLLERLYLRISPPAWCRKQKDDLLLIYREQEKLLREGQIVPAILVQANDLLFKPGIDPAAPANIVYTTDTELENNVSQLAEVADKLFKLKGTKPEDAEEAKFAGILSSEYGREFRITVPESIAGPLDATLTTIMVHRKHLPEGHLSHPFLPLLIHDESRAAMVLPARYWPQGLINNWRPQDSPA